MKYLLDSTFCVAFLRKAGNSPLASAFPHCDPSEACICSMVKSELFYGALCSNKVQSNWDRVEEFCEMFVSLPFDDQAAEIHARVHRGLRVVGRVIGAHDMIIAAIALAHDLTVVTHNLGDFSRVSGLKIEDWQVGQSP